MRADPEWMGFMGRGIPISIEEDNQEEPEMVEDENGGFIVIWRDSRSGYANLYGQRIDHEGNALWEKNGKPLIVGDWDISYPKAVSDSNGGVIVSWSDGRGTQHDIYAQRFNGNGEELWTENGVAVCTADNDKWEPVIAGDGSGGAFIAWEDHRGVTNVDIFAQHIDATGAPSWTLDGVPVCDLGERQYDPDIIHDGSGGAFVAWSDRRGSNYKIYCQHIGPDGDFSWTEDGIIVSDQGSTQYDPKIASDGGDGIMLFWEQGISSYNIHGQYLDGSGDAQWGGEGLPVCTLQGTDEALTISGVGSGSVILAWEHDNKHDDDILGQKITPDGTFHWGANGTVVCNTSSNQYEPRCVLTEDGGGIFVWDEYIDGGNDVRAQKLDSDGVQLWGKDGYPISTAFADQHYPRVASDGQGGAFFVWIDEWTDYADLFGAHIGMVITSEAPPVAVSEDSELNYRLSSNDDLNASWSMRTDADWLSLDTSGILNGQPDNSHVGEYWVEVTVLDEWMAWDRENYTIEVVNTPPVITTDTPPGIIDEGSSYTYDIDCDDDGLGIMTWSLETNADWLSINSTTGSLSGIPDDEDVGASWAKASVIDDHGGASELFFTFEVFIVNDAPVILTEELPNATEDVPYILSLEFTDPDGMGTGNTWTMETNASWLLIDNATGVLSGTPVNDYVGSELVNIGLTDNENASVHKQYMLQVVNTNDPPVISTIGPEPATQGEQYNFTLEGRDIDPGPHNDTWSISPSDGWMTIDEKTGRLQGIPGPDDVGQYTFTVTLTDKTGGSTSVTYTISVDGVNEPPEMSISDGEIPEGREGEMFYLDLKQFLDGPGEEGYTWSMQTECPWLMIDDGVIYGNAEEGQYTVEITVEDQSGGSDTITFTIGVTEGEASEDDEDSEQSSTLGWIAFAAALSISVILVLMALIGSRAKRVGEGHEIGGDEE